MIAPKSEIEEFARRCMRISTEVAERIKLSHRYAKSMSEEEEIEASLSLNNDPSFVDLPCFFGMKGWASILSVDLRKSSKRAVELGARDTYRTMHTYLPTMAEIVKRANGKVIGLRGDGLFAAFGLTCEADDGIYEIGKDGIEDALSKSSDCGKAMVEATDEILEPLFRENKIEAKSSGAATVGIGIDIGEIVITKIGISDAYEITAYSPAVNQACKLANGNGEIRFTHEAHQAFPSSKGGKIRFFSADGYFRVQYPDDVKMLRA